MLPDLLVAHFPTSPLEEVQVASYVKAAPALICQPALWQRTAQVPY